MDIGDELKSLHTNVEKVFKLEEELIQDISIKEAIDYILSKKYYIIYDLTQKLIREGFLKKGSCYEVEGEFYILLQDEPYFHRGYIFFPKCARLEKTDSGGYVIEIMKNGAIIPDKVFLQRDLSSYKGVIPIPNNIKISKKELIPYLTKYIRNGNFFYDRE